MATPSHIAVEVRRLEQPLKFLWEHAAPRPYSEPAKTEWERVLLDNPRVYDGPMVFVSDHDNNTLRCRPGTYQEFVTAEIAGHFTIALGVSGLIRYRTPDDNFLTLIGHRGNQTRIYGGTWETAPRGTVSPPPLGVQVSRHTLESQLLQECKEEIGVQLSPASITPFALVLDPNARSLDVVCVAAVDKNGYDQIEDSIRKGGNWEYSQLRWVDLEKDGTRLIDDFSPPAAALVRAMQSWS